MDIGGSRSIRNGFSSGRSYYSRHGYKSYMVGEQTLGAVYSITLLPRLDWQKHSVKKHCGQSTVASLGLEFKTFLISSIPFT